MFSLHIDTARTWRGGQNQVLVTIMGLRSLGQRTLLVAHPGGELRQRAEEGLDLIPLAPKTEMDLGAAWRLSRLIKRLAPDIETSLPPLVSSPSGFRNKAKMVVGGTTDNPTLGILDLSQHGVDLTGCGILSSGLRGAFAPISAFITRARITPYDIPARRGELKHVLLTESPDGELMLRFVLRSTEPLGRIRKHLPTLLAELPQLKIVTANLLPEHKAVLEGEEEIALTGGDTLPMRLGSLVQREVLIKSHSQLAFFDPVEEVIGAT